ncbi:MAG: insulinase family protein [Bacteroidales bacterium]|nr:insulinase family protein [Bacteroidales bacterium]
MNKLFLTIILLIFFFNADSQQVLKDLSNYQSSVLPNGLTVITVKTQEFDYINYSLIIDIHENADNEFPGALNIFCQLSGCDLLYKTQIYKNLVSDTNAVDSALNFIKNAVVNPDYDEEKLTKVKNFQLKKLEYQKNSKIEFDQIGKKFSFGKNSSFSQFPDENTMSDINGYAIELLHSKIIKPQNAYIIAVGNIEHDTLVKYASKNFMFWQGENLIEDHENPAYNGETKINFMNKNSNTFASISYPSKHYYTDEDYFAKELNAKIFENKVKETLPKYKYAKNVDFKLETNPVISEFYLSFDSETEDLYDAVVQSIEIMRDMIIYNSTQQDLNTAKTDLTNDFNNSIKNPYNIANYAYITEENKLSKQYFENYTKEIGKTSLTEVGTTTEDLFKPDNASILIQGEETDLICQLYFLAKFFRVEFFDEEFHKYKIIYKGFDCNSVIFDYLDACNANKNFKNLTIKFDATYNADTVYNVEGIIYKKEPDYYYFKSVLIIEEDTLLQKLQIANEEVWLDSSALGAEYSTQDKFWAKIYQAYIFPELYYPKLNYEPEFVCDTALLKDNIFKIKVNTPYNVFFYDYYDLNKKEKIKTETVILKDGYYETVQIVEYSDYQKISDKSDMKIPFTITQIFGEIYFTLKITEIDDKSKIDKKIFYFKKPTITIPEPEN